MVQFKLGSERVSVIKHIDLSVVKHMNTHIVFLNTINSIMSVQVRMKPDRCANLKRNL